MAAEVHGSIADSSRHALEKTLRELGLDHLFGVIITRMTRADLEMSTVQDLRLRFGGGTSV